MSHLSFLILAFSTNFVLLKLTCLVTLFDSKMHVFKKTRQNGPVWASLISSGTDEVRAKREPSLCNESVKRHFWFFSHMTAKPKILTPERNYEVRA